MLQPGARIRDYDVWGRIGGGGMSDVWVAKHQLLSVPVVIKTLKPGIGIPLAERHARMLNEARLMARVNSDRVVRAMDVGIHGDTPYLVQEYVDGLDLGELDERRRVVLGYGLPLWFVCEAIASTAHGLHAAHLIGVLHRDIKPSNLFSSPEAGIKLGDFGVAVGRALGDAGSGEVSGTASFMPPEAFRAQQVDRRSDVYGLGATAYALRYGRPPFDSLDALMSGQAVPVFPMPAGPEEAFFQHVVSRMLAPRQLERYPRVEVPRRQLAGLGKSLHRMLRSVREPDGSLRIAGVRISCVCDDIARAEADGIVCSSLPEMRMITGVGRALKEWGGDEIEREAISSGEQPLGACIVTSAGRLSARRVLHAVSAWNEVSCVGRAMQRALLAAEEHRLTSLAVPALGTGTARVSLESAASAEAQALRLHLELGGSRLREIKFVLNSNDKLAAFRDVIEDILLGGSDGEHEDVGQHAHGGEAWEATTFVHPSMRT